MRARIDEQLAKLNDKLKKMAVDVESAITDAETSLITQDKHLAEKTIAFDDEIDRMERKIERMCLTVIMRQQPVAGDLRLVTSLLKMTTDLERIGDHASDISSIAIRMADKPYVKRLDHIPKMAKVTMKMITDSIEAFINQDESLAHAVITRDQEVNNLFNCVKTELIDLINKGTSEGCQILELLMVAKYFERIGDHAQNIAEWAIFAITGVHKDKRLM